MMIDIKMLAMQARRVLEMFAQTVTDESKMMEIADMYPEWVGGEKLKNGNVRSYGVNADGETQLYSAIGEFTTDANYPPDTDITHYKKIGFEGGVAIWTQPYGAEDAYQLFGHVMHNGEEWESDCNNNVWEPGVYGWHKVED